MKSCIVSFLDTDGVRHTAEVQAETLYEAAAVAVRAFRLSDCAPGMASRLEVEVRAPSVTHTVTVKKLEEWIESASASPKEALMKRRLKTLLSPFASA